MAGRRGVTRAARRRFLAHDPAVTEPNQALRPATLGVRAGTHLDEATGGVCSPIFSSTAYSCPNAANQIVLPRYCNVPNQQVVARKLAALEHGEAAMVFDSRLAGISDGLLRLPVGIEDADDLCADLAQALARAVPRRARVLASAQVLSATQATPSPPPGLSAASASVRASPLKQQLGISSLPPVRG